MNKKPMLFQIIRFKLQEQSLNRRNLLIKLNMNRGKVGRNLPTGWSFDSAKTFRVIDKEETSDNILGKQNKKSILVIIHILGSFDKIDFVCCPLSWILPLIQRPVYSGQPGSQWKHLRGRVQVPSNEASSKARNNHGQLFVCRIQLLLAFVTTKRNN